MTVLCLNNKCKILRRPDKTTKSHLPSLQNSNFALLTYTTTRNTTEHNTHSASNSRTFAQAFLGFFAFTQSSSPNYSSRHHKWHSPRTAIHSQLLGWLDPFLWTLKIAHIAFLYYKTCHFRFKFHLPACLPH